ncbi:MAG TPA: hypothetical protein VKX28_32885 [Xanthobacteraceae bacterium]|nr:hypothetical protein [Xanthobacteraceae bacterium]
MIEDLVVKLAVGKPDDTAATKRSAGATGFDGHLAAGAFARDW